MSAPAKPIAPCVSVYDGQRCIGHIIPRGRLGFECFDADDESLGLFPTQHEAAAALGRGT